jgi:hypothetical protein
VNSQPYVAHPNLSDEINNAISESELAGGADLTKLQVGKVLIVKTQNTTYTIEKRSDSTYIHGNKKYCLFPTKCHINGSTFGGSMLKMNWVGVGMYMEFTIDMPEEERKRGLVDGHGRIVTSRIVEVTEL